MSIKHPYTDVANTTYLAYGFVTHQD